MLIFNSKPINMTTKRVNVTENAHQYVAVLQRNYSNKLRLHIKDNNVSLIKQIVLTLLYTQILSKRFLDDKQQKSHSLIFGVKFNNYHIIFRQEQHLYKARNLEDTLLWTSDRKYFIIFLFSCSTETTWTPMRSEVKVCDNTRSIRWGEMLSEYSVSSIHHWIVSDDLRQ